MKKLLVLLFYVMSFSASAQIFFLEPFVGYEFSNQRTTIGREAITIADETRFETRGPLLGVRTGMHILPSFAASLDLKYSKTSGEGQGVNYNETELERELTSTTLFASVIYKSSGNPLWGWIGAGLYGSLKDEAEYDQEASHKLKTGKSYKAGVGFFFLPRVTINIEFEYLEAKRDQESTSYRSMRNAEPGEMIITNGALSLGFLF